MSGEAAAAIGQAIRRAREQQGLSQGALAVRLGKTQSAISFWEQGRRSPDLDDVVQLVRELELDLDEILGSASAREPAKVVMRAEAHRVYRDDFATDVDEFIARAERLEPLPVQLRIANDSPVGAALELLAKTGLTEPPVPVEDVARRAGVRLIKYSFSDGISGLLLEHETGPVIGYHSGQSRARQRFTIAHELGHHLLRHYDNFHIDPTQTAADGHPPGYDWKDERAANEFAAQLLMPATWVAEYLKELDDDARLARKFKVSPQAMNYRLVNLGLK